MRGRLLFLAALAAGYVLGSRAGRRAYDRLAEKARDVWGDPNLQKVVTQTEQAAREAASLAQAKVSDLLDQATASAKDATKKAADALDDATEKVKDTVEDTIRKSDSD